MTDSITPAASPDDLPALRAAVAALEAELESLVLASQDAALTADERALGRHLCGEIERLAELGLAAEEALGRAREKETR